MNVYLDPKIYDILCWTFGTLSLPKRKSLCIHGDYDIIQVTGIMPIPTHFLRLALIVQHSVINESVVSSLCGSLPQLAQSSTVNLVAGDCSASEPPCQDIFVGFKPRKRNCITWAFPSLSNPSLLPFPIHEFYSSLHYITKKNFRHYW